MKYCQSILGRDTIPKPFIRVKLLLEIKGDNNEYLHWWRAERSGCRKKPSNDYYQQLIKIGGKKYRFWFSKSESFKDSYSRAMKLARQN